MRPPLTRQRRVSWVDEPRRNFPLSAQKKGAPAPVLGTFREIRSQGVAFHVSHHRQEVLVVLHRERFEPTLIKMAGASSPVVSMPPHRVSDGQSAEEFTDLIIARRANHEMPVIRHGRKRENRQRDFRPCFVQDANKRVEVVRLLEDRHPSHGPIQDMEDFICRTYAASSRHPRTLRSALAHKKRPDPFLFSNLNGRCERFIQTIKHECLSKFIIFGSRHLDFLLTEFTTYYNSTRSSMVRDHLPPIREIPDEVETLKLDQVIVRRHVGGLVSSFERKAA